MTGKNYKYKKSYKSCNCICVICVLLIKLMMITIKSVNISEKKGTIKLPVNEISLTNYGVEGDAHSGPWNRQVSLLGTESIMKFEKDAGRKIKAGEFAENITTEGLELWKLNPLDRFVNDEVILEVTQIGKECHGTSCTIFKEVGNCVMPKEGIFCRVIKPGILKPGDTLQYIPKNYRGLCRHTERPCLCRRI